MLINDNESSPYWLRSRANHAFMERRHTVDGWHPAIPIYFPHALPAAARTPARTLGPPRTGSTHAGLTQVAAKRAPAPATLELYSSSEKKAPTDHATSRPPHSQRSAKLADFPGDFQAVLYGTEAYM